MAFVIHFDAGEEPQEVPTKPSIAAASRFPRCTWTLSRSKAETVTGRPAAALAPARRRHPTQAFPAAVALPAERKISNLRAFKRRERVRTHPLRQCPMVGFPPEALP